MEYFGCKTNMVDISVNFVIFLLVVCNPFQCTGMHLRGTYMKRSTESNKQFKPFDDMSTKPEDLFSDGQGSGGANGQFGQESVVPFTMYVPPWLRYYMEIWNQVVSRQDDLKVKFPTEFEIENDVSDQYKQGENNFDLIESNNENFNDDRSESNAVADDFTEMPESSFYETPDNNFEIGDSNAFELPESARESSLLDDIGTVQTQINDEIETEIKHQEIDSNGTPSDDSNLPEVNHETEWSQEKVFDNIGMGRNWIQGMVDSAMNVLPTFGHQNADIAFNRTPVDDFPSHQERNHGSPDISDDSVSSGSNAGFVPINPFNHVPMMPEAAVSFGSQSGNSAPDNEQDSSS